MNIAKLFAGAALALLVFVLPLLLGLHALGVNAGVMMIVAVLVQVTAVAVMLRCVKRP